ncbi:hypothetical protein B0A69_15040 [Chryseobacterium shigense]|uniref:Uncharacterized protein n=1 Tax=Chryseobacterium shigense TaxID=297244 RepID=A0A1N7IW33_9FLAO|nr:hypothetical protein [Chryseobacterium shigense]PQA92360.1 hypothetical protein B0A69_15040 [Chryseobacterium shigense]SIS41206.1 hypothetical protein SAMN05421639_104645 [Chryseobacterium shigense]
MKEKQKPKIWEILISVIGLIGLFMLFYGIGGKVKGTKRILPFEADYFVGGLCILIPIYFYIFSKANNEEGFPLKNFNRKLVIDDIKKYRISGQVDLKKAVIESFVFGIGKIQNDYVNIFYNKGDIEFVKTKITVECTDGDFPTTITALTNIDTITLNEIFQKQLTSATVYFDKYIPSNYYIDLEFLEGWEKQNGSGN